MMRVERGRSVMRVDRRMGAGAAWACTIALAIGCGGGEGGGTATDAPRADALHRPDGPAVDGASPDGAVGLTDRLHLASGTGAPLLDQLPEGTGSDLAFRATLGPSRIELASDEGSRTWLCFQPDPPTFTTYNITTFGETPAGTFYFDIAVEPSAWAAGPVPIDGTNVRIFVGDHGPGKGTIGARATGGTLELTTAPTTLGDPCAFALADVPMEVVSE